MKSINLINSESGKNTEEKMQKLRGCRERWRESKK